MKGKEAAETGGEGRTHCPSYLLFIKVIISILTLDVLFFFFFHKAVKFPGRVQPQKRKSHIVLRATITQISLFLINFGWGTKMLSHLGTITAVHADHLPIKMIADKDH